MVLVLMSVAEILQGNDINVHGSETAAVVGIYEVVMRLQLFGWSPKGRRRGVTSMKQRKAACC